MRQFAIICLLAIAGIASAAEIAGTVTIGKTTKSDLGVGYIGIDNERNEITNACGMSIGAGSSVSGVWCTTYKPRNSELHFKNGQYTYKHVVIPPGQYFVYAKLGDALLLGKTVTIAKDTETKQLDIDLSKVRTGSLILAVNSKGSWQIRIAPANSQGKPLIKGLDLNQFLRIESKVVQGKAVFRSLPAGKYIVQLLKVTKSGGSGDSHCEAYDIAGHYTVEVQPGKNLVYKIN